ncbi:MarR family winged helix-turn-helix transcriptional regulator [Agromyces aurantiacus]|uniref:MarR family winged helix-turn-helix transcriptional regulator n=1 Tax=Agromyces aurantiacus TaxID=165814 RepID=A0ABV9R7P2_9MICO|nr:MarR family winged helix-turn-helix transcriptional regulator [Agromyces aurantiacus]MBM7503024.1 DNA-binding MarR family transcriptional regulator [Agromyces aurantiacus]
MPEANAQRAVGYDELTALHQRLATQNRRIADAFARSEQLSERELEALVAVMQAEQRGEPLTAGALGRAVRLRPAATTALIDKLEQAGHLERRRAEADRRSVTLHYSPQARAVAVQFFSPLGDLSRSVFHEFDNAERQVILRYLRRMTDAMEAHARSLEP